MGSHHEGNGISRLWLTSTGWLLLGRLAEDGRIGVRGFEPPTPSSRTKRASRVRYTPYFHALDGGTASTQGKSVSRRLARAKRGQRSGPRRRRRGPASAPARAGCARRYPGRQTESWPSSG